MKKPDDDINNMSEEAFAGLLQRTALTVFYAAILFLCWMLFFVTSSHATEVSLEQEEKDDLQQLREIQALMIDVAEALRADRHDRTVQMKGKEIEERLEKLGHEAEEREKREASADGDKDGKKPSKSPHDSNVPACVISAVPSEWKRNCDAWASLPARDHVAILQTYANDVPARWRKRIAAYFLSVQDDDVRKAEHDAIFTVEPAPQADEEKEP